MFVGMSLILICLSEWNSTPEEALGFFVVGSTLIVLGGSSNTSSLKPTSFLTFAAGPCGEARGAASAGGGGGGGGTECGRGAAVGGSTECGRGSAAGGEGGEGAAATAVSV